MFSRGWKNLEFRTSIFDMFDEVRIQGDDNWLFRPLPWCFWVIDRHDISRKIVWDFLQIYRNRFEEFIDNDFDNYIDQLKNIENIEWKIRDYCLFITFEVNIQVYRYATSIVQNHEYIHLNSNLTIRFYFWMKITITYWNNHRI